MGCVSSKEHDRDRREEEEAPAVAARGQQNLAPDSGAASSVPQAPAQGESRQRSENVQPPPDINSIDLEDVTVRGLTKSGRLPSAAGTHPQPSSQAQQQQQQQQPNFRPSPTPPSGLNSPAQRSSATSAAAEWRLSPFGTSDLSSAHTSTGGEALPSLGAGLKEQQQQQRHALPLEQRSLDQQHRQQQQQQQRSSCEHESFTGFDSPAALRTKAEETAAPRPSPWHKASSPSAASPPSSTRSSLSHTQPQQQATHAPSHPPPPSQPHPAPQQPLWMSTLAPASLPKRTPAAAAAAANGTSPPCSPPVAQLAGPVVSAEHAAAAAHHSLNHNQLPTTLHVPRWSTSRDLVTSSAETSARSSADDPPASAPLRPGQSNGFGGSHGGHVSSSMSLLDLGPRPGRNQNKTAQAMSRLGYATGPRSYTTELPETDSRAEEGLAHSLSAGSNITFSHPMQPHGLPNKSGPLASLHRSLEVMLLQDKSIAAQVHASMRGIVSLAKETDQLELGRDATGATCINQYVVVKTLGKGSFGKVKLCLNTMDGQMYAIKMVNRSLILKQLQKPTRSLRKRGPRCSIDSQKASGNGAPGNPMSRVGRAAASLDLPRPMNISMNGGKADTTGQLTYSARPSLDDGNATAFESMMREIAVLKKLDHPHVVKLHEVIDSPSATYMMLVMEFMEQGPVLDTKGQTGFNRIPEPKAAEFFRQACMGLDYLHYNHVVHGDLKPENLLVTRDGVLKIGDFGSARIINDASTSSKVSSTPAFQAPEALMWGFTEDPITSDIWALGVCLYCFVFGRLPFTGSCVLDITNSITNDQLVFPEEQSVSSSLKDLLSRLLDKNPLKRITLAETMAHPWVTFDGTQPLPCLGSSVSPPKVVEVSKDEAQAAVVQSPLVNLIRTKLKEKHVNQGSYIFREGDLANCVFMIMSGAVEIIRRLDSNAAFEANSLPEMDQSFSVDMDESFALEQGHELTPDGMDVKNGMLHVNRNKAQELRSRMKALLMGKQEEYVVEVKGPGQVFGEVSLNPEEKVQYCYSARVRTEKAVVIKLTEEAMLRGLLQQLTGDGGDEAASEALSRMATGDTHITGKALETIVDDTVEVENL